MRDLTSPARVYAQNKVWNLDAESGCHVWRSDSGDASHIAPIEQLRDFDDFIDLSHAAVSYSEAGDESASLQKPFDIREHEFSDACIDYISMGKGSLMVKTSVHAPVVLIKRDAIAIAKALGVTSEDLE